MQQVFFPDLTLVLDHFKYRCCFSICGSVAPSTKSIIAAWGNCVPQPHRSTQ